MLRPSFPGKSPTEFSVASLMEVAAGGRALTQREAPRLSALAARLHGDVLQMATTFSDDTLEAQL